MSERANRDYWHKCPVHGRICLPPIENGKTYCPECLHENPTDQARQAVIDAAVAWAKKADEFGLRAPENHDALLLLRAKLDTLQSLTTPEGKRPADVEPGTRFRFVSTGNVGVVMRILGQKDNWYRYESGGANLFPFDEKHRIIPLPEDS